MTKKLLTLIVLGVVGCFLFGSSNAQIPYTDYTTYSLVSGVATGYAVVTANNAPSGTGSGARLMIYDVTIHDCNSTANTVTIYDARTYTDATLNSRPILGEVQYVAGTTVIRYSSANNLSYNGTLQTALAGAGGKGVGILGDSGWQFRFTQPDGKPRRLLYGLIVKPATASGNLVSFSASWRKE